MFLSSGCFVVSNAGNSAGSNTVEYLVLAGGGGASGDRSGGGGAGGFRTNHSPSTPSPRDGGLSVSAQTYPITVGAGGSPSPSPSGGGKGNNSVFSTITSTGGGGGRAQPCGPSRPANVDGGSGGGGAGVTSAAPAGQGNTPPVSPSQGNDAMLTHRIKSPSFIKQKMRTINNNFTSCGRAYQTILLLPD